MPKWNPSANDIFVCAAEIESLADRRLFVEQRCNGDAALRAQVESLLAAGGQIGSFLQRPAVAASPDADATGTYQPLTEGPGTVIGPYKLLQHIGEGGFGAVYMAEQEHPVRRKVALKIIKPGMDTREVIARFESERQALAMMDHPNIARVFDAGATESGRPYFVMELVKGVPITEFCDRNKLPAEQRLKLFVTVCNAIQHAHHKGVIHRDIKPSNVMITLHDGVPVVKVIDFGVAKATAQKLTERTLFTAYGQMIGTPAYMSPEQAEMSGLDIDTRSDIFSLGVLLYELLTGTTPLDSMQLRKAGYAEMQRLIREEEAPRPSTRFSSMGGEATVLATNRGTDVKRLSHMLRSDLDWIVMKSLEKDRNRRYGSPANFAADVERYLKNEAVEACPPTMAYRLRKAYRRNKAVLTTAAVVAAALVVGTVVSAWQAVVASRAETVAIAERDEKEKARVGEAEQRAAAVTAVEETKAANEKLKRAYDQQQADLYIWDVRGLQEIWDSGNALETRRLLEKQPTVLRNFEWHYWDRLTHSEVLSTKLSFEVPNPRPTAQWTFSGDGTRLALVQWPGSRGFADPKGELKDQEVILTVWDLATRNVVRTHRFRAEADSSFIGSDVGVVQLSGDGKRIVLTQNLFQKTGEFSSANSGSHVDVFDVESGKVIRSLTFQKESPQSVHANVQLTRNGRKLIAGLQTREPATADNPSPLGKLVGSEIQVFDLDAGNKKPWTIPDAGLRARSADGSRIVSAKPHASDFVLNAAPPTEPREHTIWDTETAKELARFELPTGQKVMSPDGKELFGVVLADGQKSDRLLLKSWSAETGKERLSVPLPFAAIRQPVGPSNPKREAPEYSYFPLAFLVFNRDGTKLLVGKSPNGPFSSTEVVTVIDTQSGEIRAKVDNPTGPASTTEFFGRGGPRRNANLRPLFFTADGKQFIAADDNIIRTFDSLTGKPIHTLRGHESAVAARAEGPDGRLWSVEADGSLKQWNLQPHEPVRIGTGGKNTVATPLFALSANGARVARVHGEKEDMKDEYRSIVEVWDTAGTKEAKVFQMVGGPRGNRTQFFPNASDPTAVALSADGRRVALLRPAAFAPLGKDAKDDPANPRKVIAPADLTVWDVASGEKVYDTEISDPAAADARFSQPKFSPDGATVTIGRTQTDRTKNTLRVFDITNRLEKPAIDFGGDNVANQQLSPDGQRLAVVSWKPPQPVELVVYDVATGKRQTIDTRGAPGTRLTWSPDGKRLLVTYQSGTTSEMNLYDSTTGKLSASLYTADQMAARDESPNTWITSTGPVFSPDGRRVAGVTRTRQSGVIKVWDAESGKDLLTMPLPPETAPGQYRGRLYHLVFTPDNHKLLAVATQAYRVAGPGFRDPSAPITVTIYDATPRPEPPK